MHSAHAFILPFLAITIIEQEIAMAENRATKIEALQLGYLCCARLKNKRKKDKYKQHLAKYGIDMPANREHIKNKVQTLMDEYCDICCSI